MNGHAEQSGFRFPMAWLARLSGEGPADAERDSLVAPLERRPGGALGEDAFHYLLAIERARADRSGRALSLLLVSLKPAPGQAVPLKPAVASRLFAGLGAVVRETDVVGWYREDRVAGALLLEPATTPPIDGHPGLLQRVVGALHERLPSRVARQLHLRVVRVRPKPNTNGKRRQAGPDPGVGSPIPETLPD